MKLKLLVPILALCLISMQTFAQSSVKGVVKDSAGEPVIGASVVEKGTANGTSTDVNGLYELIVSQNAVLEISFMGYKTVEVSVLGRAVVDVVLEEDAETLSEIVVIGYGTARKSDVTGSIASMGGEVVREVPSSNISYALQNRIAGVEMTQVSSQPGADMQIRIRGQRSLSATNDPLVVLDGIPFMGKISDINPGNIKSMDILKDASSTAIYGSRGANGVILITTYRGTEGTPAQVNYNGYVGMKDVFAKYPMMTGAKYAKMREYAGIFTNTLDESNDTDTDWQDLMYKKGIVTSHDVSVSGGTKGGSYNFGTGYYHDESVIPGQTFDRIALHGNYDQGVGKYFRFGLSTNTNYNVSNGSQVGLYGVLSMSPLANPYKEDGTLKRTIQMPQDEQWTLTRSVVEDNKDRWINQNIGLGSYNTMYAQVEAPWVKGLKFRVNVGLNYRSNKTGAYTGEGINSSTPTTESTASLQHEETVNWAVENLLTYDRTFADKHQVNVVAMYSAEQTTYTKSHMAARDLPADYFQYYNLGRANGEITVNPANQDYRQSGLMSWMGRVMYSYDNRYMISATVRSDASSRLAEGHKWHTYPAVSVGWNIKNERFMKSVDWMDLLKIRVGYGETSNQAINPYATLGLLNTRPYNFGSTYSTGYYVSQLPNPDLGWEYSTTWNFGLDFSLFHGRLSGTVEYYMMNTHDILLNLNLPSTSGVSSYTGNIGKTQNKGIEVTLSGTIIDNLNGWTWDAGVNFYANRNKLVELASGKDRDEGNQWFVGYPIDALYDYEKIGLWQEGDPYLDILEPGGNVGMIKVKYTGEFNADGTPTRQIGPDDRQIMSMEPKFQGGFNTRVAYKGLDLTIIGGFKCGGKLISSIHSSSGYLNMLTGRRGQVDVDYWTPENTDAQYPKPGGITANDNPKYGSTLGYFDASYLKIRTITLGYNFESLKGLKKSGIDRLRVYLTVQNPFVFFSPYHKACGLDPETNSYGNQTQNVAVAMLGRLPIVGTNAPQTRNYMFGINLTF